VVGDLTDTPVSQFDCNESGFDQEHRPGGLRPARASGTSDQLRADLKLFQKTAERHGGMHRVETARRWPDRPPISAFPGDHPKRQSHRQRGTQAEIA